MSRIVEILGEKKFAGSKNTNVNTRIIIEEEKQIEYENQLFYRVDQEDLYLNERSTSNLYRIYGKINPYLNIKLTDGTQDIKLDRINLELNTANWYGVILKPKRLTITNTENHKGLKNIVTVNDNNTGNISLDFKNGLPARTLFEPNNNQYFGLAFLLGHNFHVNDKIYVTSLNNNLLKSGIYNVIDVKNNIIFINSPAPLINNVRDITNIANFNIVNTLNDLTQNNDNIKFNQDEQKKLVISKIKFNENPSEELSQNIFNINTLLVPEYYVAKIVEKEKLQYYMKVLEITHIIDAFDDCAFSINNYNNSIKTFTVNNTIDTTELIDNIGEPLTKIYFGLIKKTSGFYNLSKIDTYFSSFIDDIQPNFGLESIDGVNIGDTFYHSICEYSQDNLMETEISQITHRFINKNISLNYKPFYPIQLRLRSQYIEDGENVLNMPSYAVYSKQKEKYIWRDIIDVGVIDENGQSLNHPFANGAHYLFVDINFYLNTDKKYTKKYKLNINDINNDGNVQYDNLTDITDALNLVMSEFKSIEEEKPYYNYEDKSC